MSVNLSATKRIVIKVGSSTLTGKAGANLDPDAIDQLVDVVGKLKMKAKRSLLSHPVRLLQVWHLLD